MSGIAGKWKLDKTQLKFYQLARKSLRRLALQLSEELIDLTDDCFDAETDPYGAKWAPLKRPRPRGGNKILQDTRILKNSFHVVPKSLLIEVSNSVQYASYHQYGTAKMPARKMIPDSRGMPPSYTAEFQDIYEDIIKEIFG